MLARIHIAFWLALGLGLGARGEDKDPSDGLFTGPVPKLRIDIPDEGMKVLRDYKQVWRQSRPERIDVRATVREGERVYTNVAVHLKGSYTFQPIDSKPSLTLHFDRFARGQRFHGLTKVHLNNSIQDPSGLSEQFARELFVEVGVPAPRATPALVNLNGRELGVCVLVEGANKEFVKRHFASAKGNLYDGGSGGDVTKALEADSGDHPEDRSDLTNLVQAAREPEMARRLSRLEAVLDVERFITQAAVEDIIIHWDGYAIGGNNYRVFHDVSRDKMVFMPHGMDQLFGVSSSLTLSLTPPFKGMVAKALFAVPQARRRYLQRMENLATNELRPEALQVRLNRLAARLRPALASELRADFDDAVEGLQGRVALRLRIVAQQLRNTKGPVQFPADGVMRLAGWSFKGGPNQPARGSRRAEGERDLLRLEGGGAPESSGAWRTTLFLDAGHYVFTGLARSEGIANIDGTNGVMLRISGERATNGIAIPREWTTMSYEFDVRGMEDVELICELRGAQGWGEFDARSLQLDRKGAARPVKDPP
jgi:hypothetical protein